MRYWRLRRILPGMKQELSSIAPERLILHFVGGDSRLRAEAARIAYGMGHHAEVYSNLDELLEHPPTEGIIVVHNYDASEPEMELRGAGSAVTRLLESLSQAGVWLPLIAASENPDVDQVVEAIKAGALDYLPLPLDEAHMSVTLKRVAHEATAHAEARRRMVEARGRISTLSQREREVLDWLTKGSSNKTIARELDISPRTVEIHRANMMDKLGAKHSVEAVRLRLEAELRDELPQERASA